MLIFLEGLPGAGKSTNSGLLHRQFDRNGIQSRWIHEMLRLHPVLFFNEASFTKQEYDEWCKQYDTSRIMDTIARQRRSTVGIDLLEVEWHYQEFFSEEAFQALRKKDVWNFSLNEYIKVALEKWRIFAEEAAKQPEKVYILDSCLFQYQIFCFQLADRPKEELFEFVRMLWDIVKDQNPHLVYLYRESVEDQFEHIRKVRGDQFFQSIWERDRHNPYYQKRPDSVDTYYEFLRDYDRLVRELFQQAPCTKLSLEISAGNWDEYQEALLQFFHLSSHLEPNFQLPTGTYRNAALNLTLKIEDHHLIDPNGNIRKLHTRSSTEWYIQDYPVTLLLHDNQIIIGGENLTNRWTETGLVFDRLI